MTSMRERAKEHFPMVLLTLLSIVQALALELLWSYVRSTDYLFHLTWVAVTAWLQVSASFLGLMLIWVVYASTMMRFRWVPSTSDSVYPFLIGIAEFMLIAALGPGRTGLWAILMGFVFGVMVLVTHTSMRRARQDPDNAAFFANLKPAVLRDFYPQIAIVSALLLAGGYLMMNPYQSVVAMLVVLATNCMLGWQFYDAAAFWRLSVARESDGS